MTDWPIIFSAPMVRALLDDHKTMTRRLAWRNCPPGERGGIREQLPSIWQKVRPGDRLWVRENLQRYNRTPPTAQYVATLTGVVAHPDDARHRDGAALWNWSKPTLPPIHMPRWASRLTLTVTATKIERLQEISEVDAKAEGCELYPMVASSREDFRALWESLHGLGSWNANPEVVALTFTVHARNIDAPETTSKVGGT